MHMALRLLWEKDKGICHLCGKAVIMGRGNSKNPMRATKDHVIPRKDNRSAGLEDNVKLAHWRCNNERGHRTIEQYRKMKGYDIDPGD